MDTNKGKGNGKTMTVSNYTVVQGLFKQSDLGFEDGGYDLLDGSFGLIDQEGDRWGKFRRYLLYSTMIALYKRGGEERR
jgi:hypothetical protein